MDALGRYRDIVQRTLTEYAEIPYVSADLVAEAVFDRHTDRYLVVTVGWQSGRRVHGTMVHIDIIDGKVWVQRDGTEDGIAPALVAAGIPAEHIVLGFREPDVRPYSGFAVA
jgi:hypothetical protein